MFVFFFFRSCIFSDSFSCGGKEVVYSFVFKIFKNKECFCSSLVLELILSGWYWFGLGYLFIFDLVIVVREVWCFDWLGLDIGLF